MNFTIPKPLWLVPIAALALLGAGCFQPAAEEAAPTPTPAPVVSAPTPTPAPSPVPTPSEGGEEMMPPTDGSAPIVDLPEIDDTWQTYTDKAETFSFQWPTKGRLAPLWEVSLPSTLGEDGCFLSAAVGAPQTIKHLTVDGVTFCHTSYVDPAASHRYQYDYYAANVNEQNVAIEFRKDLVVGEVIGDGSCTGLVLPSSTETSCLVVEPAEYQAHLDQIVGTFKVLK